MGGWRHSSSVSGRKSLSSWTSPPPRAQRLAKHTHRQGMRLFSAAQISAIHGEEEGLGGRSCPALPRKSLSGPRGSPSLLALPTAVMLSHAGPGPAQASVAVPDPGGVIQRRAAAPRRLRGSLPQVSLPRARALAAGPGTPQGPAGGWRCGRVPPVWEAAGETQPPS